MPSSKPNETPSAPGKVPKRLSKVRFSLTRNTTCLIGHSVPERSSAGPAGGGETAEDSVGDEGATAVESTGREASPSQLTAISRRAMIATAPCKPPPRARYDFTIGEGDPIEPSPVPRVEPVDRKGKGSPPVGTAPLVMASFLPLKSLATTVRFMRYVMAICKQLGTAEGLIGYTLCVRDVQISTRAGGRAGSSTSTR